MPQSHNTRTANAIEEVRREVNKLISKYPNGDIEYEFSPLLDVTMNLLDALDDKPIPQPVKGDD